MLHRSEPIMDKIGSRRTALAGVHLGVCVCTGGLRLIPCYIYSLPQVITDSMPVAHVYDVMPFATLDYYSEITVHLTVLA